MLIGALSCSDGGTSPSASPTTAVSRQIECRLTLGCDPVLAAIEALKRHSIFDCRALGGLAEMRFNGGGMGYDNGDPAYTSRAAYVRAAPGSDTTLTTFIAEDFNVYINPNFYEIAFHHRMAILAHEEVHHLGLTHANGYADLVFDMCQ